MNIKERMLFIVVASLVVLGIGYAMVNSLYLSKVRYYKQVIENAQSQLDSLQPRIDRQFSFNKRLKAHVEKTYVGDFDTDDTETLRFSRIRLRQIALAAGIAEDDLELKSTPGRTTPGDGEYIQTGWKVSALSTLENITEFLQAASNDDYLQRIDSVALTPDLSTGNVHVSFKYYTLVLAGKPGKKKDKADAGDPEADLTAELAKIGELSDYAQLAKNSFISRDIFRPYIQAPPPPPVVKDPPKVDRPKPTPPPPPPPPRTDIHLRVVGLSNFTGNPAKASVLIRDDRSDSVKEYRPGAELDGGRIEAVDYRAMPSVADPQFLKYSRLIIRRADGFYRIDLGDKLSDAAKMTTEELPEDIRERLQAETSAAEVQTPTEQQAEVAEIPDNSSVTDELPDQQPSLPEPTVKLPDVVSAHTLVLENPPTDQPAATQPLENQAPQQD